MLQNHAQVYLGACQTSIVELLTIFAKSSIIDVWGGPKYTTGHDERLTRNNQEIKPFPANIYLFKDNNRKTRKRYEICSKLTVKTPERCH